VTPIAYQGYIVLDALEFEIEGYIEVVWLTGGVVWRRGLRQIDMSLVVGRIVGVMIVRNGDGWWGRGGLGFRLWWRGLERIGLGSCRMVWGLYWGMSDAA
jgi:hypothetical protein